MTVCLHCRHEALMKSRARRRARALHAGTWLLGAAVLATAGTIAVTAIHGRASAWPISLGTKRGAKPLIPETAVAQAEPTAPSPAPSAFGPGQRPLPSAPQATTSASRGAKRAAGAPPLVPVLAPGETTLSAGITATRSDTAIMVAFDTDGLRTRRRDKFEKLVRSTLPAIYGQRADSVLSTMPDGSIAAQGDLLNELPTRGVHLTLGAGWKLMLFPETRPGRDGPLVVRYRVAVVQ
jgi:hypothetical protein